MGGLAILCILSALVVFRKPLLARYRKWRMRNRVAPSEEFRNHPALLGSGRLVGSEGGLRGGIRGSGAGSGRFLSSLPDRTSSPMYGSPSMPVSRAVDAMAGADEEQPPAFTPGRYTDPVLEKVSAAQAQRDMMFNPYQDYGGTTAGVAADDAGVAGVGSGGGRRPRGAAKAGSSRIHNHS